MKKLKIWSIMMLVAMALPMMVACGGKDDSDTYNSGKTNTTEEVAISSSVTKQGVTYAYIDGYVNLNLITSSYSNPKMGIEYSTQEDLSNKKQATTKDIVGNKISVPIYSLNGNTKYYYRTYVNVNNLNYCGKTLTFTTKDVSNVFSTIDAIEIGANSVKIKYSGDASTIDKEEKINASIAYSKSKDYLLTSPNVVKCPLESLVPNTSGELLITNLDQGTTYYYCAITYAGSNIKNTEIKSFTTQFKDQKKEDYVEQYKQNFRNNISSVISPNQSWGFDASSSALSAVSAPRANEKGTGYEPTTRIIAEDLTLSQGTDFDFNDIVLDVQLTATGADCILQAAGATLPIRINGEDRYEVHKLFGVATNVMVNTYWSDGKPSGVTKDPVRFSITGSFKSAKDIKIEVNQGTPENPMWIELFADRGEPASKIAVTTDFAWPFERQNIKDRYPKFPDWVKDPTITWY